MKKRTIALLLALTMTLPLAACTPNAPAEESETPPVTETTQPEETPSVEPSAQPSQPVQTPEDPGDPEDPAQVQVGERETTLTIMSEGEEETVPAIRYTSWLGYAITYDPAVFAANEDETADVFMAELVEGRPNVYLAISVVDGLDAEETVEGLRLQMEIEDEGTVTALGAHDYAATHLHWAEGAGGNDAITDFYVTEQNGTVFLVELGNFVDGEEGFGARLNAMLATLTF